MIIQHLSPIQNPKDSLSLFVSSHQPLHGVSTHVFHQVHHQVRNYQLEVNHLQIYIWWNIQSVHLENLPWMELATHHINFA